MRLCNSNVIINLDNVELIQKTDFSEEKSTSTIYLILFIFDTQKEKPVVWKYNNKEDRDRDFDEIIKQIRNNNTLIDLGINNTAIYSE